MDDMQKQKDEQVQLYKRIYNESQVLQSGDIVVVNMGDGSQIGALLSMGPNFVQIASEIKREGGKPFEGVVAIPIQSIEMMARLNYDQAAEILDNEQERPGETT